MISGMVPFTEFIQVYIEIKAKTGQKDTKWMQFVEEEKVLSKLKSYSVCADRQAVTLSSKHPTFKGLMGRQFTQGYNLFKYTFVWKETAWPRECSWGETHFLQQQLPRKVFSWDCNTGGLRGPGHMWHRQ